MYVSSRNKNLQVSSSQAIIEGLATDGGLFVPNRIPKININEQKYLEMSYKDFAKEILTLYLDDFSKAEIDYCVENAYTDMFEKEQVAPVKKADGLYFIELYHGKTLAFKDVALSILPFLILTAKKKNNIKEDILIVTATSGDTGKAALEAFKDREGIKIIVYYPDTGVSDMQKHQMITQKGDNLHVYAISGNFDDAQNAVKKAFNSSDFKSKLKDKGYILSSANSINIGRLIPQIVYYITSYFELVKSNEIKLGDKINIAVPTGNFGNILAAYYASEMGLPVNKLLCASNMNKVLADFFLDKGSYDINRKFYTTESPSMDILISSNFERIIYHASKGDSDLVKSKMQELKDAKKYQVSLDVFTNMDIFTGEFTEEDNCKLAIQDVFKSANYLIDPHTAVAVHAYKKYNNKVKSANKVLVASTASPFKFPAFVLEAIDQKLDTNTKAFDALRKLEKISKIKIPKSLADSEFFEKRFDKVIDAENLEASIFNFLETQK